MDSSPARWQLTAMVGGNLTCSERANDQSDVPQLVSLEICKNRKKLR